MTGTARVGTIADKLNDLAVCELSPPRSLPARLDVSARATGPVAFSPSRGDGAFLIQVLRRREFGDYAVQDGAELLHAHQHAGAHFHEARKDRAKTGTAYARCS